MGRSRERGVRKVLSSYSEVARAWGAQSQAEARYRSMYFDRNVIYSYGTHFPIAMILQPDGHEIVLVNSDRYSVTTSGHQSEVRYVLHRRWLPSQIVHAPTKVLTGWNDERPEHSHAAVLVHHATEAKDAFEKALRARTRKSDHIDTARHHFSEANKYASIFGLPQPFGENVDIRSLRLACALSGDDEMSSALNAVSDAARIRHLAEAQYVAYSRQRSREDGVEQQSLLEE